ncbi:MAG TPA: N-6 DNA methylase [Actinomycetes bacterium]|nr:N-6 DNA methylase [Actinomycetes bacterium]
MTVGGELAPRVNRARRVMLTATSSIKPPPSALAVLAAVPAWWARRVAAHGIDPEAAPVWDSVDAAPPFDLSALADVGAREDLWEASPEALGDAYVCALDAKARAETGRHYTPAVLAAAMWQQTLETLGGDAGGLVLDLACGTGALLVPPLRTWVAERGGMQAELALSAVTSVVAGCDLDETAVWLGNVLLAAELLPLWARVPPERRRALPAVLTTGDGLQRAVKARVVIMNPPYGRVRLAPDERARWSHAVYGHANRYGLFMAGAVDQVEEGGVVTALVPAGWLGGSYFQRLRSFLAERAPLTRVGFVGDRSGVFATGVLQETLVASFTSGAPADRPVSCERIVVGDDRAHRQPMGLGRIPDRPDLPWLLPRDPTDTPLVDAAAAMPARLSDYGWVASTGPLVWNRHRPQLSRYPGEGLVRVVWAADLDGGRLHQDPARDDLRYCLIRNEKDERFLVLGSPAVLVPRTTAPEQPRRLLGTELDRSALERWGGRVVVENHVNVLTCTRPDSPLTPGLLVALLGSEALDRLYRCLTGSVAVSAYELAALPMPDADTLRRWQRHDAGQLGGEIEAHYAGAPR